MLCTVKSHELLYPWNEKKPGVQHRCKMPTYPYKSFMTGMFVIPGEYFEEVTGVSEEIHSSSYIYFWFEEFFNFFINIWLPMIVMSYNKIPWNMKWCVGSGDAFQIGMVKYYNKLSQHHNLPKVNMPSRAYNIFVNHWRWILSKTYSHLGWWNDKTFIPYVSFDPNMHNNQSYSELSFTLTERKEDEIVYVQNIGIVSLLIIFTHSGLNWFLQ